MSEYMSAKCLNILLIALCAIMAAGLAFYAYQAYQWKSVALEALSLNQKFVDTNNELLDMMEGRNGD